MTNFLLALIILSFAACNNSSSSAAEKNKDELSAKKVISWDAHGGPSGDVHRIEDKEKGIICYTYTYSAGAISCVKVDSK